MIRLAFLFLILIVLRGFSQDNATPKLSPEAALVLSKNHLQKAFWFMDIPQYNYDSTMLYAEKAFTQLDEKQPLHYQQLALTYHNRSKNISIVGINRDSVAQKGWWYVEHLENNEENRIIRYNYLIEWAVIKLERGERAEGLKLFQSALSLVHKNEAPEFQATVLLDKGYFYIRYGTEEERKQAIKYLRECLAYFKHLDKKKNATAFARVNATMSSYYLTTDSNSDSAYYYLFEQESILPYIKNPRKLAIFYSTFGRELITIPLPGKKEISAEQYEEGRIKINKAVETLTSYNVKNDIDVLPYCYGLLADMDLKDKKYDEAIANYKKCYDGYTKVQHRLGAIMILEYIGNAYQQKGDLENALKYKEQFYKESIKFEEERNERSMRESELQVNVLKQEQQLEEKDNQQKILIVVVTTAVVLLCLIFYYYKLKQKSSKRLADLNHDLESKNLLLDKRNADNELLLKEIHHRVKNNLEVVSSLLALQSAQIADVHTKEAMLEGQNRVNSIGIVHQKLYQGENLGAIEMKDYFLNLGENIIDTFGANQKVELELAMDKLNVDIDTAVPLGLIVNELLTNTLKYAFTPGQIGKVSIRLEKQSNGTLHLEVADNGKGKSGVTKGTGFGSQLVVLLTKQLNGVMREENLDGTRIIFDFKG